MTDETEKLIREKDEEVRLASELESQNHQNDLEHHEYEHEHEPEQICDFDECPDPQPNLETHLQQMVDEAIWALLDVRCIVVFWHSDEKVQKPELL